MSTEEKKKEVIKKEKKRSTLPVISKIVKKRSSVLNQTMSGLGTLCGTLSDGDEEETGKQNSVGFVNSFFEVNRYKVAIKRVDRVQSCVHDFTKMIEERVEIERKCELALKSWSEKWMKVGEKSVDYGTSKVAWCAVVKSAEREADIHKSIRQKLKENVLSVLESNRRIHSSSSTSISKTARRIEKEFEAAQKPWVEIVNCIEQDKRAYANSTSKLQNALRVESIVRSDHGSSAGRVTEIINTVSQIKLDLKTNRERYEQRLIEAEKVKERYIRDMSEIFKRCSVIETKRLEMMKDVLMRYLSIFSSLKDEYSEIINPALKTVRDANVVKDVEWWQQRYGPGTIDLMNWPKFKEYSL